MAKLRVCFFNQKGENWDQSCRSKEQIEADINYKQEAARRRERALAYAYSHQVYIYIYIMYFLY